MRTGAVIQVSRVVVGCIVSIIGEGHIKIIAFIRMSHVVVIWKKQKRGSVNDRDLCK